MIVKNYETGNLYAVLMEAWESTVGRERKRAVVYVSLQNGEVNVMDRDEFWSRVEHGGEFVPRFAIITDVEAERLDENEG